MLAALAIPSLAGAATRGTPARLDARAADTLLARGGAHAKELEKWAGGADLGDLVWLMRRPPAELGASLPVLARAAYAHTPPARTALRARLVALGADERGKRPAGAAPPPRPSASVFRVGAFLPDSGDYADYARSVSYGLEAGLASIPLGGGRSFEYEFWGTGDNSVARLAAALEAGSWRDGLLVGELLSVNTLAFATGARLVGLPLLSPTGTDETIGTVGPQVFQIGPSGWSRGGRLAHALVSRAGLRVGVLVAGDPDRNPFALGFLAAAESLEAHVEWRAGYTAGTAFRLEVQTLAAKKLDVLLWDGEPREIEALLREMSKQKVAVQICGGEALAPEQVHAETRVLMEGIRYVSEEWKLSDAMQARLDSALVARGTGPSSPLHVRGWLAGRALAAVVAAGALCPEEVAEDLRDRCGAPPWLSSHRFLDVAREGATLPLYVVQRGHGVRLPE